MTSNRVADQTHKKPSDIGSPRLSTGSAVGGHDHLKDAPQDFLNHFAEMARLPTNAYRQGVCAGMKVAWRILRDGQLQGAGQVKSGQSIG